MSGSESAGLTRAQIAAGLRALGLSAGDQVVVHSSMRSFGPVAGGADTVIDALLEVVGPQGNVMVPTFNYSRPLPLPYYDVDATAARTGILVERFRQRPQAIRSLHPTHSVAVIGPQARQLTDGHLAVRAFGVGSPLDRLAQAGGKVLLLGVGHTANSTVHVAEEYAQIPKVSFYPDMPQVTVRLPDGALQQHTPDTSPSCSAAFAAAEHPLRCAGVIRDGRIGSCLVQIMAGRDVIAVLATLLAQQPDALLCNWKECHPCQGARANLRQAGRLR